MTRKILLVGNGAREHAIASALCQSKDVQLYAYMSARNPGIEALCKKSKGATRIGDIHLPVPIAWWATNVGIDLAFPSPDAVLAAGVGDELQKHNVLLAAPNRSAARLEWDKAYLRNLMGTYRIPGCPKYGYFKQPSEIDGFIDHVRDVAVKPIGLTGGKGVKVTGYQLKDANEAKRYAREVLSGKIGGDAGVLIEEKLEGEEFTLHAFVSGRTVIPMPCVQDHKRAYDGDLGPNCYSEDTEILTENGWKKFNQLSDGAKVAIYQPRFRRIRFEKPKQIYWKKYKGPMVQFKHREIDLLVTPNHRMLIQLRRGSKKGFKVVEARDYEGENFIPQTGRWFGAAKKYFTLPPLGNRFGPRKRRIKIDFKAWAAFLGLYLSEGYVSDNKTKGGKRVHVCQSKTSKHFAKMGRILRKLPFSVSIDNKGFRISSSQLYDYLKGFGFSHQKYVPDYIKNTKPEIIATFLGAYCLGDGDMHRGQMRICTSSGKMAGDLQELFIKTGKVGIITVDKRTAMHNPINKKDYPARPIFAIEVKKRTKCGIRKNNVRTVNYEGHIGCVTVSTGFIVVRRNYRVAISGNTGGMGSYSGPGHLLPFISAADYEQAVTILEKIARAFELEAHIAYRGILYGQFMLTAKGVMLVEVNARFGDPEAINVLALLKTPLVDVLEKVAEGKLRHTILKWSDQATVVKYLVPDGYPVQSVPPTPIKIDAKKLKTSKASLYYASVDQRGEQLFTGSSRAIAILGMGKTLAEAEKRAEAGCKAVQGPIWHRPDIGTKKLVEKRVEHMKKIRGR